MAIIYKIIDNTNGNCYIGSTIYPVHHRISAHRCNYNRFIENLSNNYNSSFEILKNDNYDVEVIETCEDDQRFIRERFHIDNTENVVNKNLPTRDYKHYYVDNQDKLRQSMNNHYKNNINNYRYNKKQKYIERKEWDYIQNLIETELDN